MEEISTVVGEKEHPSWDDLQKMTLVRNCAKEAMRIYSAGGILARTVPDDTQLLGYEVPGRVSFDVLDKLAHAGSSSMQKENLLLPHLQPCCKDKMTRSCKDDIIRKSHWSVSLLSNLLPDKGTSNSL